MIFLSVHGANDEITRSKYTSYAQLLRDMQPKVIEDFDEMGSDFYLNKPAMCLMGLSSLIKVERKYASQQVLKTPLSQSDKTELFGQMIDVFEDFLGQLSTTEVTGLQRKL